MGENVKVFQNKVCIFYFLVSTLLEVSVCEVGLNEAAIPSSRETKTEDLCLPTDTQAATSREGTVSVVRTRGERAIPLALQGEVDIGAPSRGPHLLRCPHQPPHLKIGSIFFEFIMFFRNTNTFPNTISLAI